DGNARSLLCVRKDFIAGDAQTCAGRMRLEKFDSSGLLDDSREQGCYLPCAVSPPRSIQASTANSSVEMECSTTFRKRIASTLRLLPAPPATGSDCIPPRIFGA